VVGQDPMVSLLDHTPLTSQVFFSNRMLPHFIHQPEATISLPLCRRCGRSMCRAQHWVLMQGGASWSRGGVLTPTGAAAAFVPGGTPGMSGCYHRVCATYRSSSHTHTNLDKIMGVTMPWG
jgi:hypothetical protein